MALRLGQAEGYSYEGCGPGRRAKRVGRWGLSAGIKAGLGKALCHSARFPAEVTLQLAAPFEFLSDSSISAPPGGVAPGACVLAHAGRWVWLPP